MIVLNFAPFNKMYNKKNRRTMKKNFLKFGALCVATILAAPTLFCACSDDDGGGSKGGEVIVIDEGDELPPIDSLKVKTNSRTYVFPQKYERTGEALVNRVLNKATTFDTSVQTVILHDKSVASLTDNDYKAIVLLIARGGNLVYSEPTRRGADAFIKRLKTVGLAMYRAGEVREITDEGYAACRKILLLTNSEELMLPPLLAQNDADDELYDIFAFRGNDYYTVENTDDDNAVVYTSVSSDGLMAAPAADAVKEEPDDDDYEDYFSGLHADDVAKWLDNPTDKEAQEAKGRVLLRETGSAVNLRDLESAQIHNINFTAYAGHKACPVHIRYEIWAVNNTARKDYYLCNQEVEVDGSKLNCGPKDSKAWDKTKTTYGAFKGLGSDISAYWAYFTGMSLQMSLLDSKGNVVPKLVTSHVSPTNKIGEETFTRSTEWSLEASFTAASKGSIKGGVKVSESRSYKVPTIQLEWTSNNNNPKWEYSTPVVPKLQVPTVKNHTYDKGWDRTQKEKKKNPDFSRYGLIATHDEAKPIMRQDFTVGHTWLWEVDEANDNYTLRTNFNINLQALWYEDKTSKWHDYKKGGEYKTFTNVKTDYLALNPPPRFEQKWMMELVADSQSDYDKVATYMKEYFGDYWKPSFELYTVNANDTILVNMQIDSLEKYIDVNRAQLERAGLPAFSLNWIWKTSGKIHHTYKYTPAAPASAPKLALRSRNAAIKRN